MAERCCRKRGGKDSAVFVTVRFQIVFGEKAESNLAFSAKVRSETNRCRQNCRVKLSAFGSIQRIQRRNKIMRFRRISGVKRSVFAENAELNGAFLAIMQYLRNSDYVL